MGEVAFCKMISLDGRERQDADICGYGEDAGCILLTEQVILNLLPSGTYERYVKFYLGLLLLILLLQPVLQLFHLTGQLDSRVFTSAYEWEEQAETWKTEWKLSEDWRKDKRKILAARERPTVDPGTGGTPAGSHCDSG